MALVSVRVVPRAARNAIERQADGSLRVHLTAPPVDGKANAALEKLLAEVLAVPVRSVRVTGGHTARIKRVTVDGLTDDEVAARLDQRQRA
jgi:uncharacterized protein YggU (UPF0235/DUF167 family)